MILNPRPAASPSAPRWAFMPEMIRASLGSATLYRNICPAPFPLVAAHGDGSRRGLLEHEHAGTLRDRLGRVRCVSVEALRSSTHRNHHLAHLACLDRVRALR